MQIDTIVFDVTGTLTDERGTILAAVEQAMRAVGSEDSVAANRFTDDWRARMDEATLAVATGQRPWQSNDDLRRATLEESLAALPYVRVDGERIDDLAHIGHRLRPWPDAPDVLNRLRERYRVVALTNSDLGQVTDMSAAGGLGWHGVLTGSMIRSYKPDPATYDLVIRTLQTHPRRTLIVAAHPWDLRAAAEHGWLTGYFPRPYAESADAADGFDVMARDSADLVAQLTAPR